MEKKLQKIYITYYNLLRVSSSLSNLANNLSEGIDRIKCKSDMMKKNVKHVELNISTATVFLNT